MLAGTALVLATTAQAPTASADIFNVEPHVVCAPEDEACERDLEAKLQNFVEWCKEAHGTVVEGGCLIRE